MKFLVPAPVAVIALVYLITPVPAWLTPPFPIPARLITLDVVSPAPVYARMLFDPATPLPI